MSNKAKPTNVLKGKINMEELIVQHLTRIEVKVDQHAEALNRFTRTEERVVMLLESFKEMNTASNALEARIATLEKALAEARTTGKTIGWILTCLASIVIFLFGVNWDEIMVSLKTFLMSMEKPNVE